MRILGVDTSSSCGSLGIIDGDQVVAECTFHREETHSTRLIPSIQALLRDAKLSLKEIDGLAVSLGPGSFTGLRVGISTIKGLALADEKPVVGIPTLDVLAYNFLFTPYTICPLLDARRDEVYTALYRKGREGGLERLTSYRSMSPIVMLEEIPFMETIFAGNGVTLYGPIIKEKFGTKALIAPPYLNFIRGLTVAQLGLQRILGGERAEVTSLMPIYVRPSDAEVHKDFPFSSS
jgi:tRNA threonylcarbamoyladenosine biosynthesis protein TsaB